MHRAGKPPVYLMAVRWNRDLTNPVRRLANLSFSQAQGTIRETCDDWRKPRAERQTLEEWRVGHHYRTLQSEPQAHAQKEAMMLVLKTDKIELLQEDGGTRVAVTRADGIAVSQWLSKGVSLDLKIVDAYPTLEEEIAKWAAESQHTTPRP